MESSAKHFWNWFKENNSAYLFLNTVDAGIKQQLLDTMQEKLHLFCDGIFFEIGGSRDQDQELIITAEGDVNYFAQVEELVNAAPQIPNWSFIAFIPPRDADFEIDYEGVKLNANDLYFDPMESVNEPGKLGVRVYIPNYEIVRNDKWLRPAVFKVLDTVLGEKSFASDVHFVEIAQLSDDPVGDGFLHLSQLPKYISWKKSRTER